MSLEISGYSVAHYKSGNYGGSTQHEVFPSEYYYTYFNVVLDNNQDYKGEFQTLINHYVTEITVNNSVTLKEYLTYLYLNDTTKINEVHSKFDIRKPVGSADQELSTLFFVDNNSRVLEVSPYSVSLNWNDATTKLNVFLQKHAFQYKNIMKDEFLKTYHFKNED